jgi:hypothetical protein
MAEFEINFASRCQFVSPDARARAKALPRESSSGDLLATLDRGRCKTPSEFVLLRGEQGRFACACKAHVGEFVEGETSVCTIERARKKLSLATGSERIPHAICGAPGGGGGSGGGVTWTWVWAWAEPPPPTLAVKTLEEDFQLFGEALPAMLDLSNMVEHASNITCACVVCALRRADG